MDPESALCVSARRVIGLRYIMRNRDNQVVEDRTIGEPVIYLQGSDVILPSLQSQLEGLAPGQRKEVTLSLEPGNLRTDFRFEVQVISVRPGTPAEISLGYPLPLAGSCGPDCECYQEQQVSSSESAT